MTLQDEGHIPVGLKGPVDVKRTDPILEEIVSVLWTREIRIVADLGGRAGQWRDGIVTPFEFSLQASGHIHMTGNVAKESQAGARCGWEDDSHRDMALCGRAAGARKEYRVIGEGYVGDLVGLRVGDGCAAAAARDWRAEGDIEAVGGKLGSSLSLAGGDGGLNRAGEDAGDGEQESGKGLELHSGLLPGWAQTRI